MQLWKLRFSGAGVEAIESGVYAAGLSLEEAVSNVIWELSQEQDPRDPASIELVAAERLTSRVFGVYSVVEAA